MYQAITNDINVSVETFYQESVSQPDLAQFIFAYRITIRNHGDSTIKLLRRHWYIIDAYGNRREVEGEGVVGLQPVLEPDQSHEYVSGCDLATETGKMYGTYLMERLADGHRFYVNIPEFIMAVPYRMN